MHAIGTRRTGKVIITPYKNTLGKAHIPQRNAARLKVLKVVPYPTATLPGPPTTSLLILMITLQESGQGSIRTSAEPLALTFRPFSRRSTFPFFPVVRAVRHMDLRTSRLVSSKDVLDLLLEPRHFLPLLQSIFDSLGYHSLLCPFLVLSRCLQRGPTFPHPNFCLPFYHIMNSW